MEAPARKAKKRPHSSRGGSSSASDGPHDLSSLRSGYPLGADSADQRSVTGRGAGMGGNGRESVYEESVASAAELGRARARVAAACDAFGDDDGMFDDDEHLPFHRREPMATESVLESPEQSDDDESNGNWGRGGRRSGYESRSDVGGSASASARASDPFARRREGLPSYGNSVPPSFDLTDEDYGYWSPPEKFGREVQHPSAGCTAHYIKSQRVLVVNIAAYKLNTNAKTLSDFRNGSKIGQGATSEIANEAILATQTLLGLVIVQTDGSIPNGTADDEDEEAEDEDEMPGQGDEDTSSRLRSGGRGKKKQATPHQYMYVAKSWSDGCVAGSEMIAMRTFGVEMLLSHNDGHGGTFRATDADDADGSATTLAGVRLWIFVSDPKFEDWKGFWALLDRNLRARHSAANGDAPSKKSNVVPSHLLSPEVVQFNQIKRLASNVAKNEELAGVYRSHHNAVDEGFHSLSDMKWGTAAMPFHRVKEGHCLSPEVQLNPLHEDRGAYNLKKGLIDAEGRAIQLWPMQADIKSYFPWNSDTSEMREAWCLHPAIANRHLFHMLSPAIVNPLMIELPPAPCANNLAPPQLLHMYKEARANAPRNGDEGLRRATETSALVQRCLEAHLNNQHDSSEACNRDTLSLRALSSQMSRNTRRGRETDAKHDGPRPMAELKERMSRLHGILLQYDTQRKEAIFERYQKELELEKKDPAALRLARGSAFGAAAAYASRMGVEYEPPPPVEPSLDPARDDDDGMEEEVEQFDVEKPFLEDGPLRCDEQSVKSTIISIMDTLGGSKAYGIETETPLEARRRRLKVLDIRCTAGMQAYYKFGLDQVYDMFCCRTDDLPPGLVHGVRHAFETLRGSPNGSAFYRPGVNLVRGDQTPFGQWASQEARFAKEILRFRERPALWIAMYTKHFETKLPKQKWVFKCFGRRGCGKSHAMDQLCDVVFPGAIWQGGTDSLLAGCHGKAPESGYSVYHDEQPTQSAPDHPRQIHYKKIVTGMEIVHQTVRKVLDEHGHEQMETVRFVTEHQEAFFILSNQTWRNMTQGQADTTHSEDHEAWIHRNVHYHFREKRDQTNSADDADYKSRLASDVGSELLKQHRHMQALVTLLLPCCACIPHFGVDFSFHAKSFTKLDKYLNEHHGAPTADSRGQHAANMILEVIAAINAVYIRFFVSEYQGSKLFEHIDEEAPFQMDHLRGCAQLMAAPTPELCFFAHCLQTYTRPGFAPVFQHVAQALTRHVDINPSKMCDMPAPISEHERTSRPISKFRDKSLAYLPVNADQAVLCSSRELPDLKPFWKNLDAEQDREAYIQNLADLLAKKRAAVVRFAREAKHDSTKRMSDSDRDLLMPTVSELALHYKASDVWTRAKTSMKRAANNTGICDENVRSGWTYAKVPGEKGMVTDYSHIWIGDLGDNYHVLGRRLAGVAAPKNWYCKELRLPGDVVADASYIINETCKVEYRCWKQRENATNSSGASDETDATPADSNPTDTSRAEDPSSSDLEMAEGMEDLAAGLSAAQDPGPAGKRAKHPAKRKHRRTAPAALRLNDGASDMLLEEKTATLLGFDNQPYMPDDADESRWKKIQETRLWSKTKRQSIAGTTYFTAAIDEAVLDNAFPQAMTGMGEDEYRSEPPFDWHVISNTAYDEVKAALPSVTPINAQKSGGASGFRVLQVNTEWLRRRALEETWARLYCAKNPRIGNARDEDFEVIGAIEETDGEAAQSPLPWFYECFNYAACAAAAQWVFWKMRPDSVGGCCASFVTPFGNPRDEGELLTVDMTGTKDVGDDPYAGLRPPEEQKAYEKSLQDAQAMPPPGTHQAKRARTNKMSVAQQAALLGRKPDEQEQRRMQAQLSAAAHVDTRKGDPYINSAIDILSRRWLLGNPVDIGTGGVARVNVLLCQEMMTSTARRGIAVKQGRTSAAKALETQEKATETEEEGGNAERDGVAEMEIAETANRYNEAVMSSTTFAMGQINPVDIAGALF